MRRARRSTTGGAVHTVYRGSLVDGRPQGYGEQAEPRGSTYKGQWVAGLPQGAGEVLLENGDQYVGALREGAFHGAGVYSGANGRIYAGRFERGVFFRDAERSRQAGRAAARIGPEAIPWRLGLRRVGSVGDGIDFRLATDRARYRKFANELVGGGVVLAYDHLLEKGRVKIIPDWLASWGPDDRDERLYHAWKGSGRIDSEQLGGEYGHMPTFIIGDVTNNTRDALNVERLYLDLASSVPDLEPFPVVTTGSWAFECSADSRNHDVDEKIVIENYGWGGIENAETQLRFSNQDQEAGSQSRLIGLDLGDFSDFQAFPVRLLLEKLGLRTGELYARRAVCPSLSRVPRCIEETARTGLFGELAEHLYADGTAAVTDIVGVLRYQWVDYLGERHSESSPYRIQIPVYGFEIPNAGPECGATSPVAYSKRHILLPLGRFNYRIDLDVPESARVIRTRQNVRFAFVVDSEKSARHSFRIVLGLSDGREIKSPPAVLNIFRPRMEKNHAIEYPVLQPIFE